VLLGNMEGCFFLGLLREKKLFREIFVWISRYEKCPVNRYLSLPRGPCWGTWRESICQDF